MGVSQNQKILNYLETSKHGITSMDAFSKFKITRLSGRIYDLKHSGHDIETYMVRDNNEDGDPIRYARYFLRK